MKKILLLIPFFSSFLFGFTLTDSSSEQTDTVALLLEKVTQLEMELDEMKRESVRNPISSGSYKKWGKGLTIAVEYPYLSAELGYTFKIIKENVRLGFSGGYAMRPVNESEWPDEFSHMGEHFLYWKILAGTPVFFNLMSFSGSLSQMYDIGYRETISVTDTVGDETTVRSLPRGGLFSTNLAANAEFWISPKMNIFVGMNVYFSKYMPNNIPDEDTTEYSQSTMSGYYKRWVTNNFKVGVRYYFGSFRDMDRNRKNRKKKKK